MRLVNKYTLVLCCFVCLRGHAQEAVALSHYVFSTFTPGKVLQKDGKIFDAKLNYNVLSGEIIFEAAPNHYMALAHPEQVDTVYINNRKFLPVKDKFYELLTLVAYPLFLEYTCTVKEPGSDLGYGMVSVTTASPAIKALIQGGAAYSLKLPDGFAVVPGYAYRVLIQGKYEKANNAKQLIAALPDKKQQINELIKKNHTDFANKQDIIDLLNQL